MFSSRRVGPENLPMDQNVVLLFFEYLVASPDERGAWRVLGKDAEPLEAWLRAGWKLMGQSQSSISNLSGMQAVLVAYTLSHVES